MTMTAPRPTYATAPDVASGVVVTEEEITPDYAARILDEANRNPRKLRKDKAEQYAYDMIADNWPVGMGVIGFDDDGYLVDGQHRFAACVMSGCSFRTLVARGVSQQAVDNADRGFKRSVADILKGKGEVNVTHLQSALSMSIRWDLKGPLNNITPTWPMMETYLKEHPEIRDAVSLAVPVTRKPLAVRCSVSGPFAFRVRQIDEEAADVFFHQFATGIGLSEGDSILKLREVFLSRKGGPYARPTREHDLALMVKSWNAFIQNKPLKQLKWNRSGRHKEGFPWLLGPNGKPWPFPDYLRAKATQDISPIIDANEYDEDDD